LRTLVTVASFIVFVAIVAWAWSPKQRNRFEEAAQLPFAETETVRTGNGHE